MSTARDTAIPDVPRGSDGAALPSETRVPYERFFGVDLAHVRIHDNPRAHESAETLDARAFTHGSDVFLGRGALDVSAPDSQRLIAHELSHAVQQRDSGEPMIMRQQIEGTPDNDLVCRAPQPEPMVCEAPAQPAALGPAGTLNERIAAFKQSVLTMAVHRLVGNQRSLDLWADLVRDKIPDEVIGATALQMSQGVASYIEMQDIRGPATREVTALQAAGLYHVCTGCHLLKAAREQDILQPHIGEQFLSPNERRRGAPIPGFEDVHAFRTAPMPSTPFRTATPVELPMGMPSGRDFGGGPVLSTGYRPPPANTAEGAIMRALPDPTRIWQLIEQARPILRALGPDGYQVLPGRILEELMSRTMADIRREVIDLIRERQHDYGELIQKIQAGELSYDKFAPIIRDLLPVADDDVRAAIQDEMDRHAFWKNVEMVVIGILSIAALLLTIFPPTTALGLTLAGALDVALASYAVATGPEMIRTGRAYMLGTGANDVFTREQQQAGGMMMLGGFVSVVLAPLGIVGGTARMATGLSRMTPAVAETLVLLRAGQTIERGEFVVSMAEDGSIIATSTRQPDMLIIVRGDTATLYQSMGPGGMRVVATMPTSEVGAVSDVAAATDTAAAARGPAALEGAPGSQRLLTSGARTPEDEYAEFLRMLEEEGATGRPSSGAPVTMQPHAAARDARELLGVTGADYQSAHGLPQSVGRSVPGYNPRAALTTLEETAMHTAMDGWWKQAFQILRRQGRTTATAQEVFDTVSTSIRGAPLESGYADSLIQRLSDEMFIDLGMAPNTQLTLPYPNIGP